MKYIAKPVEVEAEVIKSCEIVNKDGSMTCILVGGEEVILTKEMISRYIPEPFDYYVTQEDGYVYINPQHIFERKYQKVNN